MDRSSSLMAVAKARVWASEGWEVTIIVSDRRGLFRLTEMLIVGCWG